MILSNTRAACGIVVAFAVETALGSSLRSRPNTPIALVVGLYMAGWSVLVAKGSCVVGTLFGEYHPLEIAKHYWRV
jgi:hypothetical protein